MDTLSLSVANGNEDRSGRDRDFLLVRLESKYTVKCISPLMFVN